MASYRVTSRRFSRLWRRSKDYSDHEIRWLARKRGLDFKEHGQGIQLTDPVTGKAVVQFQPTAP